MVASIFVNFAFSAAEAMRTLERRTARAADGVAGFGCGDRDRRAAGKDGRHESARKGGGVAGFGSGGRDRRAACKDGRHESARKGGAADAPMRARTA